MLLSSFQGLWGYDGGDSWLETEDNLSLSGCRGEHINPNSLGVTLLSIYVDSCVI